MARRHRHLGTRRQVRLSTWTRVRLRSAHSNGIHHGSPRTTTVVVANHVLRGVGLGQVPRQWRQTGPSLKETSPTPLGRQRLFATFGFGRSVASLSQSPVDLVSDEIARL